MTVGPVDRDAATAEFFDGTAAGQFLLRQCQHGHYSEPAATACTTCSAAVLHFVPAAGGASLISWAVTWPKASADRVQTPTVLVIAELDEGPWWWSQLIDANPAALAVGDRLAISFLRAGEGCEAVPVFRLDR